MEFTIRAAVTADIPDIRRIEVAAGALFAEIGFDSIAAGAPPSTPLLLEYLAAGTAWVAVNSSDDPLGFALASVVDDEGHLDQVSVLPEATKRGIGRALIDAVADWTIASGFEALTLTTFRDVAFNGPIYTRMGFVELDASEIGPELEAIRETERANGIDVAPRIAMRCGVARRSASDPER